MVAEVFYFYVPFGIAPKGTKRLGLKQLLVVANGMFIVFQHWRSLLKSGFAAFSGLRHWSTLKLFSRS